MAALWTGLASVCVLVGLYSLVLFNGEGRHWAWPVVSAAAFAAAWVFSKLAE